MGVLLDEHISWEGNICTVETKPAKDIGQMCCGKPLLQEKSL